MKIDLSSIDREMFIVSARDFHGEEVYLITPQHIGCKWIPETLHFRSSVWNAAGELISASFKKFFNFEEQPDIGPFLPEHVTGASAVEKLDGSTFVVSRYKGQWMFRTRGTIDATGMRNGHEVELFKERHADFLAAHEHDNLAVSYLFEWTSPENKIVLDYGKDPCWTLIAVINHDRYDLWPLTELNALAEEFNLPVPKRYTFDSIDELLETIRAIEGVEGVCLYYDGDQHIRKIKGIQYLKLHAFKSNCSLKAIVDLYFAYEQPTKDNLLTTIESTFDFECRSMAEPLIDSLYADAVAPAQEQLARVVEFVRGNAELSQKDFALKLLAEYSGPVTAIAFTTRKGQVPDKKNYRKHLETFLNMDLPPVQTNALEALAA